MMTVESKILARIKRSGRGWCFTPKHFTDLGSNDSVRKALSQLANNGVIKRLAFGIYEYPRQHEKLGELPPNIQRIIEAITEKDKISFQPSGAYAANLLGLSEQVPAKIVLLTNGRSKTFHIGNIEITFRRTTPKNMLAAGRITGLLIQACKFIGKENISEKMLLKLKKNIKDLESQFNSTLANLNENWKLEIDRDDGDGQTILFHYPSVGISQFNNYINQSVKIEIGARSDHWPSNDNVIMPFIEETSPGTLLDPRVKLKVLSAERTFWEKATILHKFAHFPTDKNVPERQSRHYYDFYKLLSSDISHNAINNLELLARVREHKQLYFRAAWASYSFAKKGALKIIPDQRVLIAMDNDYNKMSEMFYGEKIKWPEIINKLETFEASFNA